MSRVIDGFINDVCSYIKYKGVHKEVKDELSLHIDELKDSYTSKGLSEEDAEKKAIADMGNAAEIGEKLNKQGLRKKLCKRYLTKLDKEKITGISLI